MGADCQWGGCLWGQGHEGPHEVRCACFKRGEDPKKDCARCGGRGSYYVGPAKQIRAWERRQQSA